MSRASEPRRVRAARRRRAWHTERARAAQNPEARLRAATSYLQAAAAHAPRSKERVRQLAEQMSSHAEQLAERVQLAAATRQAHLDQIRGAATAQHRLGHAARYLRLVLSELESSLADETRRHYTEQLSAAADELLDPTGRKVS